ncbi:hypothetical protein KY345_05320, partial [Candidatus Woesearchaeota archaeon]|nr:hypothetical protein [Candidatus Woesearchaeota archaeon]
MKFDKEKSMEHVKCEVCGSDDFKIIYKPKYKEETQKDLIEKYRSSGDETLIDQVVRCNKCGFIYINPRLK